MAQGSDPSYLKDFFLRTRTILVLSKYTFILAVNSSKYVTDANISNCITANTST